jgi:hypothetical protein
MTCRLSIMALSLVVASCSTTTFDGAVHHFSGVWLYEFEGSTFLEGARKVPAKRPTHSQEAWLDYHPDQDHPNGDVGHSSKDAYDLKKGCYPIYPFAVTFRGRKVTRPLGSGHLGNYASEMKVDRMLSMRSLGPSFCYETRPTSSILPVSTYDADPDSPQAETRPATANYTLSRP